MKTIKKFTAVVALMFTIIVSAANEPKLNLVADSDAKSLVFKLDTQSKETSIKLIDDEDHVIYSENIAGQNLYSKKFDLQNLNNGLYFLKVDNPDSVIKYTVRLADTKVEIIDMKEKSKPFFRLKDEMVYLNLLNTELDDVKIKVYNGNNDLLYKETIKESIVVEKAFNFKKAYQDNYVIVIQDKNETYYKEVNID